MVIHNAFATDQVAAAKDGLIELIDSRKAASTHIQFESWAVDQLDQMALSEKISAVRKFMDFGKLDPRGRGLAWHQPLVDLLRPLMGGREPHFCRTWHCSNHREVGKSHGIRIGPILTSSLPSPLLVSGLRWIPPRSKTAACVYCQDDTKTVQ